MFPLALAVRILSASCWIVCAHHRSMLAETGLGQHTAVVRAHDPARSGQNSHRECQRKHGYQPDQGICRRNDMPWRIEGGGLSRSVVFCSPIPPANKFPQMMAWRTFADT